LIKVDVYKRPADYKLHNLTMFNYCHRTANMSSKANNSDIHYYPLKIYSALSCTERRIRFQHLQLIQSPLITKRLFNKEL